MSVSRGGGGGEEGAGQMTAGRRRRSKGDAYWAGGGGEVKVLCEGQSRWVLLNKRASMRRLLPSFSGAAAGARLVKEALHWNWNLDRRFVNCARRCLPDGRRAAAHPSYISALCCQAAPVACPARRPSLVARPRKPSATRPSSLTARSVTHVIPRSPAARQRHSSLGASTALRVQCPPLPRCPLAAGRWPLAVGCCVRRVRPASRLLVRGSTRRPARCPQAPVAAGPGHRGGPARRCCIPRSPRSQPSIRHPLSLTANSASPPAPSNPSTFRSRSRGMRGTARPGSGAPAAGL